MREDAPETIVMHDGAVPKCFARSFTRAAFAFPSAAGAERDTTSDPSAMDKTDSFFAFGFTFTEILILLTL